MFFEGCSLLAAELEDGSAEAVELVGGETADLRERGECLWRGRGDAMEDGIREDEEGGQAGGFGFVAAPGLEAIFEG